MSFSQEILKCEGIVLRSFPYKEHERLLTLMTKERGLVSVLFKKTMAPAFVNPPAQIELLYKEGRNNLCLGVEAYLINSYEKIRNSLPLLLETGKLLNLTLKTQKENESAVEVYTLLRLLLSISTEMEDPEILSLLFAIKIILFEGMTDPQMHCASCQIDSPSSFAKGGWFCSAHAPQYGIKVEKGVIEDWAFLLLIRNLEMLKRKQLDSTTKQRLHNLIQDVL